MPFPATHPLLAEALTARGYAEPTPVQAAVLAPGHEGRDLLVSAQTGSGKTVAFGLALAETLIGAAPILVPSLAPRALVVAPTRELALQVERELAWLWARTGARLVSCVGGMDPRRERRALEVGADIVVGTPGRLRDHIERGALDLSALEVAVLDEADEMLDLGFREDLTFILDAAPATRRTLLFSATIPPQIAALARDHQTDAMRIDTVGRNAPHADIAYRAVRVAPREIEHAVVNVLRQVEARAAMVFCATREQVRHLHASLLERGFSAVALSGELSQAERTTALQSLRDGRARVCVATDVAARGIDLPHLDLVVHADLPNDREALLHRSGRTGRAGRKGVCALIVPVNRRRKAEGLIQAARIDVEWSGPPTIEEIRAADEARFLADPTITEAPGEDERDTAQRLLETRTPEEIAAALVRLWRARLPAPEDVSDPGERPQRRTREEREAFVPREKTPFEGRGAREREPREARERLPMAWFTLSVGRRQNADPKWLLPLICRLGEVERGVVGPIRIFPEETRFGIVVDAAERFAQAAQRPNDENVRVARADGEPGPQPGFGKPAFGKPGPGKGGFGKTGPARSGKGGFGKGEFGKDGPRGKPAPRGEAPFRKDDTRRGPAEGAPRRRHGER
ncbi:DEAD/DEAH box helicase [Salinarimonas rosea]|uniref:DEAD/DEAH box helicase n=1 Tax=Salinarimonas rosea TaxID=552063 RepID=UPI0003FF4252|nr:DEAD/DEAH box helicase [Salinarimonas rosea]